MPASESDRALVERIRRGDHEAVSSWLVDLCGGDIEYLSRFYNFPDLLGALYLAAIKTLASWNGTASLRTWTRSVAVNVCLQNIRNEKRQMLLAASTYEVAGSSDGLRKAGAEDLLDLPATREAFDRAMEALTPRERTVIHMNYFLGVPLSKIGEHLEESAANTYQIHKRAKEKLRQNWFPQ